MLLENLKNIKLFPYLIAKIIINIIADNDIITANTKR